MEKFVFLGEGTQFFLTPDFGNLKGDQKIGKIFLIIKISKVKSIRKKNL